MQQVLVTGANGLLGCHLVRELLASGHRVRALVRAGSDHRGLNGLAVEKVEGDVRDAHAMRNAVDGCEVVYHAAAVFSYWGYSLDEMQQTARQGAHNVVEAAKDAGVRRLVLTSSTAVLGAQRRPVVVDEAGNVEGTDHPHYFLTKALQERVACERARELGVALMLVHPAIFVGPHDFRPSASLATLTSYLVDPLKLTFDGGCSVVHAADVARAHLFVCERGRPFERHVVAGENVYWTELHRMISDLCGVGGPGLRVGRTAGLLGAALMELGAYITGKPPLANREMARENGGFFWYSNAKLKSMGFEPRPLRETLVDTLAWLLESHHLSPRLKARLRPSEEVLARRRAHLRAA